MGQGTILLVAHKVVIKIYSQQGFIQDFSLGGMGGHEILGLFREKNE